MKPESFTTTIAETRLLDGGRRVNFWRPLQRSISYWGLLAAHRSNRLLNLDPVVTVLAGQSKENCNLFKRQTGLLKGLIGGLLVLIATAPHAQIYTITAENYSVGLPNYFGILVQHKICSDAASRLGMCDSFDSQGSFAATESHLILASKEITTNNQAFCVGCEANAFGIAILDYPNDFATNQNDAQSVAVTLGSKATIVVTSKELNSNGITNATSGIWAYSGVTPPTQGIYQLQDEFALQNATAGNGVSIDVLR